MARNIRVSLALNQIERGALDSHCAKHKIQRSQFVRQVLVNFLCLPPDERDKIRQPDQTLPPQAPPAGLRAWLPRASALSPEGAEDSNGHKGTQIEKLD
jgi:hypothetical protein